MITAVLAARGGVGRTTLALSLAKVAAQREKVSLYEFDLAFPKLVQFFPWQGEEVKRRVTQIVPEKCTLAKKCLEACQFGVIREENGRLVHDLSLCRGCGVCREVCPERAIEWQECLSGWLGQSEEGNLRLLAGKLAPHESWDGYLIHKLKERFPFEGKSILKAPLGLGAQSLRAIKEAQAMVLVIKESPSTPEEVHLFGEIVQGFGLPGAVVINGVREKTKEIEEVSGRYGLRLFSIPQISNLRPGQSLIDLEPSLEKELSEILSLAGGGL